MGQLTDFGRKVVITLVLVAAAALLFAGYKLIYLPLAAVESRYWDWLINILAGCFAAVMVAGAGWAVARLVGSARRGLTKRGRPVYAKTKDGKEFVGWELPDGSFTPKPLPGFGSQATSISLHMGHQGYPPKYLMEQPLLPEEAEEEEQGPTLPTPPDFRTHLREIGPNHFLLGNYLEPETGQSKPLWASLDDIISLVAIGPQGMGKTTLARSLALMQTMHAGELHVVDYFNDVAAEMRPYFPHCYSEPAEIEAYAETVLFPEMERRETLYKQLERNFPPLLLIVDEWLSLRPDCPVLAEALKHGFTDWRKLNFRMVLLSVQLERADLGVSKSAASTVALFNANENLARTWGFGGKEVLEALRALRVAGRGFCVVSGQTLQRYASLIALPNITSAFFREVLLECRGDIRDRVRSGVVEADRERAQRAWNSLFNPAAAVGQPQLPPLPMKAGDAATPAATTGAERPQASITPIWTRSSSSSSSSKRSKVTREQRKAICRMFQEETQSITAIARTVLGARGGEPFYLVKEVLAEEGLLVNEPAETAEEEQVDEQH